MRRFTLCTLRDFGMGKIIIEDKITEECENLVSKFKDYKGFNTGMYLPDPVTIALSLVTFVAIILYGMKKKVHPNYPPGPPCLPIIGNMLNIDIKKPYQTFEELAKKYGSVYSLQIGAQKMVVLCGYEAVKDALINHAEEFAERPNLPIFLDLANKHGLSLSDGDSWKAMKKFTISTLKDFGVGKRMMEDTIIEECEHLVNRFKAYKGKPFYENKLLHTSVANIMVSILLGYRFDYEDAQLCTLLERTNDLSDVLGGPLALLYNSFPTVRRLLPGIHRSLNRIIKDFHTFIRKTFINQRNQLDVNDQRNFIDAFLIKQQKEKSNPESYFSDENLIEVVIDLFAAGVETVSATLQWCLLLMTKYPDIQKNVQNEIEKVIGSGKPCFAHRKQMPYTDAVIHEIQRFGNVVPTNLPHATSQDVTFKGFFIPKGTQIIPLLYSVLRDKEHFQKPDLFYPEHFLDSDGNFLKNEAFLPFSAGKRTCIGKNLAKMELFLFFIILLQNFTFQTPPGVEVDFSRAASFVSAPVKHEICAISHK